MRLVTATLGAINGIMAEMVDGHIAPIWSTTNRLPSQVERDAADELVDGLRAYIR